MSTITLQAKVKLPVMPNFLHVDNVRRAHLDDAIAAGADTMTIDVADLDEQGIQDFCAMWTLAFTRHCQQRRVSRVRT
jgi:hypothetical protein